MALLQDYNKLFEYTDNIKKIYVNNNVVWPSALTPPDPKLEPFYVENISNNVETLNIVKMNDGAPTLTIEYSTDKVIWNTFGTTSTTALTYTLQPNDKLYLRCNTIACTNNRILGVSKVGGNIMSLLYGSNFTGQEVTFPANSTYTFGYLLGGTLNQNLTLVDVTSLILPAITLCEGCYRYLFYNCPYIVTAPELPATTLVQSCYEGMFSECYNLNNIKCLATSGIDVNRSTQYWTTYAPSTGTFYCAQGMSKVWPTGISGIPEGWTIIEV